MQKQLAAALLSAFEGDTPFMQRFFFLMTGQWSPYSQAGHAKLNWTAEQRETTFSTCSRTATMSSYVQDEVVWLERLRFVVEEEMARIANGVLYTLA